MNVSTNKVRCLFLVVWRSCSNAKTTKGFTKQRLNNEGLEHQGGEKFLPEDISLTNASDLLITLLQSKSARA